MTEQQIQDVSKTMTISYIGIIQSLGLNTDLEKVKEIRQAFVMDLRNGSIEKSVKQYNELINHEIQRR